MLFFGSLSFSENWDCAYTGDIFRLICIVDISKTIDPSFHFISKTFLVLYGIQGDSLLMLDLQYRSF